MTIGKATIWEDKFSDNFKPNILETLVKKFEVSRRDVIRNLLPKNGGVLLDIACGSGETILSVVSRFDKIIGLDISKKRIGVARKRALLLKNVEFINYDFDKGIPLKNKSVDFVICEASLSYFYDLNYVFSEVSRVLKPSGRFIIEVPNYAFLTRRLALFFGKMPKTSSFLGWQDGGALHYFNYQTLKTIIEENGFKVITKTNSGVLPEIRRIYPELLAGDIIYVCKKLK